jgi:hypothetical protein
MVFLAVVECPASGSLMVIASQVAVTGCHHEKTDISGELLGILVLCLDVFTLDAARSMSGHNCLCSFSVTFSDNNEGNSATANLLSFQLRLFRAINAYFYIYR